MIYCDAFLIDDTREKRPGRREEKKKKDRETGARPSDDRAVATYASEGGVEALMRAQDDTASRGRVAM